MPTAKQLYAQTAIIFSILRGGETAKRRYPDNEWGIALQHYDIHVEWFRPVKLQTKEEAIRQDTIDQLYPDTEDMKSWAEWHKNNPKQASIPYNESTYDRMKEALEYLQKPPEPIRDCLVYLAEGNDLVADDLFVFLQMYAEFIAAVEILYSYDPYLDPMKNQRAQWNKKNKLRWLLHAASEIKKIMDARPALRMEQARNSFARDVLAVIQREKSPPVGWTIEEYEFFLSKKKNQQNFVLKKPYGQNLTKKKIEKLLRDYPQ